jgi:hypothetical protein
MIISMSPSRFALSIWTTSHHAPRHQKAEGIEG